MSACSSHPLPVVPRVRLDLSILHCAMNSTLLCGTIVCMYMSLHAMCCSLAVSLAEQTALTEQQHYIPT